jgi:hypothetical protein
MALLVGFLISSAWTGRLPDLFPAFMPGLRFTKFALIIAGVLVGVGLVLLLRPTPQRRARAADAVRLLRAGLKPQAAARETRLGQDLVRAAELRAQRRPS